MELVIQTDLSVLPKKIDFNFLQLKSEISERLKYYNGIVVTVDGIKSAKSDRAKLNKFKEAIDSRRKEIKSEILAPYNEFEKQCKELVSLIEQPIVAIDTQIKVFEEAERQEKYVVLNKYFEETVSSMELAGLISFEQILNKKWANKSVSLDTLKCEIYDQLERVKSDLEVIGNMQSRYINQMKAVYLNTLDISKAIAEDKLLSELEKKFTKVESKEPQIQVNTQLEAIVPQEEHQAITTDEPILTASFEVSGTKSQIIALRDFMIANRISFAPILK